ncbi:hypothetical protein [Marichromatium gracile]|uniref:Uncharacterized protein n=1 Tax=Marichromatium gracile TaxID=1048 RepID=A0A4R4AA19_MARGR|nr:hypothetical protein [Marichromatium gracile]MBK1708516.1 hypothetical protein [Marichromatium gracile]TCW35594.1 hypothetical protein EDC29_106162 [Marichromatium gracile]
MKYAAKRTWPLRSPSWEHEGEAESFKAFATEFAAVERLGADGEFVVIDKSSDEAESRFFRVVTIAPYQVEETEPRSSAPAPEAGQTEGAQPAAEQDYSSALRPAISMLVYMGKVAVIAVAVITIAAFGIGYIKDLLA